MNNSIKEKVLVIGFNTADIVLRINDSLKVGEKSYANSINYYGGGQAANCAYTLAKLGYNVRYIGKFGDDINGKLAMNSLKDVGVCLDGSTIIENCANHVGVITVDTSSGERTIVMMKDEQLGMSNEELIPNDLLDTTILYTDGNESEFTLKAAKLAHELGVKVVADLERIDNYIIKSLPYISVLIAPIKIINELAGTDNVELSLKKLNSIIDVVVATEGSNGSTGIDSNGEIIHVDAEECEVVDTTGAGDAFHAGYIAATLEKMSFVDSLKHAAHIARKKCEVSGPRI